MDQKNISSLDQRPNSEKNFEQINYGSPIEFVNPKIAMSLTRSFRSFVFVMATLTSIILNMDHGSIPAITNELRIDLSVNDTQLGAFGSLVYLGNFIGKYIN